MYAAHDRLRNLEGPVTPEMQLLIVTDPDYVRLVLEQVPHDIHAKGPKFGNLLDAEVPLKGKPIGLS